VDVLGRLALVLLDEAREGVEVRGVRLVDPGPGDGGKARRGDLVGVEERIGIEWMPS